MIHTVKALPEYFDSLADYSKPFEVRKNDRPYRVGDFLAVNEWSPVPIDGGTFGIPADGGLYSGRSAVFEITYILDDTRYVKDGYVILGLSPRQIT